MFRKCFMCVGIAFHACFCLPLLGQENQNQAIKFTAKPFSQSWSYMIRMTGQGLMHPQPEALEGVVEVSDTKPRDSASAPPVPRHIAYTFVRENPEDAGGSVGKIVSWIRTEPPPVDVDDYEVYEIMYDDRGRARVRPNGVPLPEFMGGDNLLISSTLWMYWGFPYLPEKAVSPRDEWTETVPVVHYDWKKQGWKDQVRVKFKWQFHAIEEFEGRKCAKFTYEGASDAKLFSWEDGNEVPALQCSGMWYFDMETGIDVYIWKEAQVIDLAWKHKYTFEKVLAGTMLSPPKAEQ